MAIGNLESVLGVNPFGKQIDVERRPESVQEIEIIIDEVVENLIEKYNKIVPELHLLDDLYVCASFIKTETLTPHQIELVMARIIKQTFRNLEESYLAGCFISKLLQKSYYAGHNNFTLTTTDDLFHSLGRGLKGTKKNPIQLTIYGNVGNYFGYESKNCAYTINGNTGGYFGKESEQCFFAIEGRIDYFFAQNSQKSTYSILDFNPSMFEYSGYIKPQDCIFETKKEETYNEIVKYVPRGSNKVRLIGKNNSIIKEISIWY